MTRSLSSDQVEQFVTDGFVRLPEAFPRALADEGRAFLWQETGLDPDDPATWTEPVVRLSGYGSEPFRRAATTERLHDAFDQLVGPGRWVPRDGLGTFPIRFPHPADPGDAGWHMDGSFTPEGESGYWVNLRSRERALLMLFLFSDVDEENAPTRIKVGSHLDVPAFLQPVGEQGLNFFELCRVMDEAGRLDAPERPLALATGQAGDVYLCHPFLIHAAQPHHGTVPRFIAQPPLIADGLLELDRPDGAYSPVERAVRLGLGLADR
ncbi:phytanoyl-CoA dioxygenase family protein [Streptacidiphilus jiangxiensis]|uniref:Phytanoyl-CoA dioxygenase (PhyH) n=1 Tax=Streptacidiphilus jiangxiensis TaxID=235985 RepID=A0A1H7UBN6_STRJI|nr:phytanoyl-CoA dioxygenase family protein [Streptacidiphilus jiangxiensis]SEL94371.1 Phytanoyl-CoA dioxygenase (PhyH) [Streptacidiphilus jiangxiensis]